MNLMTPTAPATPKQKAEALATTFEALEKKYGKGTVMRLGDRKVQPVDVISTGALSLDLALGCGGYPRGRVVEIYGPESSGKTTLTLHAIAAMQKKGGTCAFIDAEHALDVVYAKALGVDTDALIVSQPDNGEQALEVAEGLLRSGAVDLVVIDSVAALVPQAELEGEMGDAHMGLQARLMSQALRKITGVVSKNNAIVIFINQLRQKIGVTFGNGETTTGGNALKFYASQRLEIRRIGSLTDKDQVIGAKTKIKVVKNKVAAPFVTIEVDIVYGRGFCPIGDVMQLAEDAGVIERNGAWFTWGDLRLQGKERLREKLLAEPELLARLQDAVRAKGAAAVTVAAEA